MTDQRELGTPSTDCVDSMTRILPSQQQHEQHEPHTPLHTPSLHTPRVQPPQLPSHLSNTPMDPAHEAAPSSSDGTADSYDTERRMATGGSCCERLTRRIRCLLELCGLLSGQRRPLLSAKAMDTSQHPDPEAWGVAVDGNGSEVDSNGSGSSRSGLLRRRADGCTSSTLLERQGGAELRELELQRADERV